MSASYRAIFILSIFMVFFVLIAGAATKSKSSGFGMWIWGYTAWLMYKRRNADLVSFYKGLLWFDVIAAGIALSVLTFSEGDLAGYVGYTAVEAALLFAIVISLTYGLYRFFSNQSNLISESTYFDTNSSIEDKYWEQAFHEFNVGDRAVAIWARAFSEAEGDENKAKARYLMMRAIQLQQESGKNSLFNENETIDHKNKIISIKKPEKENAVNSFIKGFKDGVNTNNEYNAYTNTSKSKSVFQEIFDFGIGLLAVATVISAILFGGAYIGLQFSSIL